MKQAAVVMQWIILFVGLLINIDSGDCAIRAEGDYKTVNCCGRFINFNQISFICSNDHDHHVQAPGVSGGPGQCVTLCWTLDVAGGSGPGSGGL